MYAVVNLERQTLKTYATIWNRHVLPRIGEIELRSLTPLVVASSSGVRSRALTPSTTATRASSAMRASNWPWPTSRAMTLSAPRSSSTSVNPPVEAPTSSAVAPAIGSGRPAASSASRAASSLCAARLTYLLAPSTPNASDARTAYAGFVGAVVGELNLQVLSATYLAPHCQSLVLFHFQVRWGCRHYQLASRPQRE